MQAIPRPPSAGLALILCTLTGSAAAQQFDLTPLQNVNVAHVRQFAEPVGVAPGGGCSGALIGPTLFVTAEHCLSDYNNFEVGDTVFFQDWPGAVTWIPTANFPFISPYSDRLRATVTAVGVGVNGGWPALGIDALVVELGPIHYTTGAAGPVLDLGGNPMMPGELLGYLRVRGWKQDVGTDVCMTGSFPAANGEFMSSCGEIAPGDGTWIDCEYDDACRHSTMHSLGGMSGAAWIDDDGFLIGINRGRYEPEPGGLPACWWDDDIANQCYATGSNAHNSMRHIGAIQDMMAVDAPRVDTNAVPVFLTAPYRHWMFYREQESAHTLMMGRKHTATTTGAVVNYPFLQRDATLLGSQLPEMARWSRSDSWKNSNPALGHVVYVADDGRLIHAWGGSGASWSFEDLSAHLAANQTPIDVAGWRSSNGIQHIAVAVRTQITNSTSTYHLVHLYYTNNNWTAEQVSNIAPYGLGSLTAWQSTGSAGGAVQHVAWFDVNGRIMDVYHSSGSWNAPSVITAQANVDPWRHNSLTAVNASGNQHLAYVDRDDHINVMTWSASAGQWIRRDVTALSGGRPAAPYSGQFVYRLTVWSAEKADRTLSIGFMNDVNNIGMVHFDPQDDDWHYNAIALGSTKTLGDGSFYDERPYTMVLGSRFDDLAYVGRNGHIYYITTSDGSGTGANVPTRNVAGEIWLRYDLSARTGMPAPWEYDPVIGRTFP